MGVRYEVATADEMVDLGIRLGESWTGGGMVAVIGAMGAGKTHFTKGFARGLGYCGEVTSPTFALLQEYRGGRLDLLHLDWYRMESAAEVLAMGWDELLDQSAVVLVEWADLFPELWQDPVQVVRITAVGDGRVVEVG